MADIKLIVSGVALLWTKQHPESAAGVGDDFVEGEVAFLVPDEDKTLQTDTIRTAGVHNPLLIVKAQDLKKVEGPDDRFPLDGAVLPAWLDKGTVADYVGWSLAGSTAWLLNDETQKLKFDDAAIAPATAPAAGAWNSVRWVPHLEHLLPALRLDPAWRKSPHVSSRFLLGAGQVSGTDPVQGVASTTTYAYGHQTDSSARFYSDAFCYTSSNTPAAIVVQRGQSRTIVRLESNATKAWLLNLDDPRRSLASRDHFALYGLLPWNFDVPRQVAGVPHTGNDCWSVRYSE